MRGTPVALAPGHQPARALGLATVRASHSLLPHRSPLCVQRPAPGAYPSEQLQLVRMRCSHLVSYESSVVNDVTTLFCFRKVG